MVRVALAPHPLLLVTVVVAVYAAIPHAVMAIDLSRLYGHLSTKRNGKRYAPHLALLRCHQQCHVAVERSILFLLLHITSQICTHRLQNHLPEPSKSTFISKMAWNFPAPLLFYRYQLENSKQSIPVIRITICLTIRTLLLTPTCNSKIDFVVGVVWLLPIFPVGCIFYVYYQYRTRISRSYIMIFICIFKNYFIKK